ncbi:MAG: glycosyltransferase family 9 protein, partial [Planctomycetota bacterium]|nr:glycosyltransferase family 9 protein [Planctomycetota bacterium]
SSLVARLSGAPRVLGFDRARAKELSWIWTRERIEPGPRREHMVRQYMRFPRLLGLGDAPPRRSLPASAPASTFADDFAASHGAPLLLNLGASRPDKRWPPSSFRGLAVDLLESPLDGFDGPIVLTGGPEDRAAADEVARDLEVHDLVGRTNLPELWALCARSRAMVSADTGPMHLCAAVGTPTVALFGPGDPARTGPFGEEHVVLVAGRPLAMEEGSVSLEEPHAPAKMTETTPRAVRTALERLLDAGHGSGAPEPSA